MTKASAHSAQLAIASILLANLSFSMTDLSAKWLVLAGFAIVQLAFMRFVTHLGITVVQSVVKYGVRHNPLACKTPGLVILRGVILAVSTICNFVALKYLSPTVTSTIMFSAPLIVALLSWPMLGEAVGRTRWMAIFLGFVGILIVTRPLGEDAHWATLFSLSAATLFALYSILTRKLCDSVSADTMQFYLGLIGTIMYLPLVIGNWVTPTHSLHWTLILILGPCAWCGHQLLTWAHSKAPANLLMPFSYSFIIYMAIGSLIIFQIAPDFWTYVGAGIIVIASLIIWRQGIEQERQTGS